ncbi:hypothetical protein EZS27_010887 [termite gut metagenome]|uniref:Uncharacterized protein n=1 Tax=termite gut metagenome TaxID=433724 RepID=A0A5J4S7J2_9ZZZZ
MRNVFIKDLERYSFLKKKLWNFNKEYKKISAVKYIGDCSYLYDKLKPTSYEDFLRKYIFDGENKPYPLEDDGFYGKSIDEIYTLAEYYRYLSNDYTIPLEDYLDDLINHIIIETYDGHVRENYIKKCFEDTGYCVESINGDEDSIFGIDMKVYKNKKLTYLIQIKPYTAFYKSPKINDALIIDRKRWFKKEREALNKYSEVDYYYILYMNKGGGKTNWVSKDDSFLFKINELSSLNGDGLLTFDKFKENEIIRLQ